MCEGEKANQKTEKAKKQRWEAPQKYTQMFATSSFLKTSLSSNFNRERERVPQKTESNSTWVRFFTLFFHPLFPFHFIVITPPSLTLGLCSLHSHEPWHSPYFFVFLLYHKSSSFFTTLQDNVAYWCHSGLRQGHRPDFACDVYPFLLTIHRPPWSPALFVGCFLNRKLKLFSVSIASSTRLRSKSIL